MCLPSHFSLVQLFVTPGTVARQAPLSMGFSSQEYWSGPFTRDICVCVCIYIHTHVYEKKVKESVSRLAVSDTLWPQGLQPTRLLCPWHSPGKNTRVSCHSLLQGIFPTQGSKSGLLHCRQIIYQLSHQGSPIYVCMYMHIYINVCVYTYIYVCIYTFPDSFPL